jgi:hypothetical protein
MTSIKRGAVIVGLVACMFVPSIALCAAEEDIVFRGEIPVPTSGDRLDLFITLFALERQSDGTYTVIKSRIQSHAVQLDPGDSGSNNSFEFAMDPTADSYQFMVEVVNMSGIITGNYLFNYDDLQGEWDQHMVSVASEGKLPFHFRLAAKNESNTNRVDMMENKDGGYDFFLYHWAPARVE